MFWYSRIGLTLLPFLPAAMLFGCLLDGLPYGYFQSLRWIVCISAGLWAYHGMNQDDKVTMAVFLPIALLFNPLKPFYFDRSSWLILDILTGVAFFVQALRHLRSK